MLPGINRNQKRGGTEVWHVPKQRTEASQREAMRLEGASLWACLQLARGLGFCSSLLGLRHSPIKRGARPTGTSSQTKVSRILARDINRLLCEKRQTHLEKIQPSEVSTVHSDRDRTGFRNAPAALRAGPAGSPAGAGGKGGAAAQGSTWVLLTADPGCVTERCRGPCAASPAPGVRGAEPSRVSRLRSPLLDCCKPKAKG